MNPTLERILQTQTVSDGTETLPLRHVDFPALPVHMDAREGAFLTYLIELVKPSISLEIGMAFGVSTLFICDALSRLGGQRRHIVSDPHQSTQWRSIGLRNVQAAGFAHLIDFREERSEYLLPKLAESGTSLDFALVDGWHTFDQVMLEFYYIDRMLRPGGVVAFDDADRPSVSRAIRYALQIPGYEVVQRPEGSTSRTTWAGTIRRSLRRLPHASSIFRADFLARDWDIGIGDTCVAIRKTQPFERSSGWYCHF
jgi:predicted O-methyltransferase YrrM